MNGNTTHGDCTGKATRLYNSWRDMRKRCEKPSSSLYQWYGQRGISVCDEWQDYPTFKKWALSNGYKEHLTIDRGDVDGNYEPSNCSWETRQHQTDNRRQRKDTTHPSGYKHIRYMKPTGRWQVVIKRKGYGAFATIPEAVARRDELL